MSGHVEKGREDLEFGELSANARLKSRGELEGEWTTTIGSAGTFVLFPHDRAEVGAEVATARKEQMHTARHDLGAMAVDRQQLTEIANELQKEFSQSEVVVTVLAGTEKSCLCETSPSFRFLWRGRSSSNFMRGSETSVTSTGLSSSSSDLR